MNYLAHCWLARDSDEAILGALLGDFVRGQAGLVEWPPVVRAEILRHRRIDRYTDQHPAVVAARGLFGGLRRYAGIVLDVYFDHRLARDWARWNAEPLPAFSARVYRILAQHADVLPPRLAMIAPRMAAHDWLASYRLRDNVDAAIRGISTRLSRNGDRLLACLEVLRAHEEEIGATYDLFFPQLITAAAQMRLTADAPAMAGDGSAAIAPR
ncbi:acyl carrier protein phosphodiesterase [Luteimonas sp. e5]